MEIEGEVEAAVSTTLAVLVLLGGDVPELKQLLGNDTGHTCSAAEDVMVVVTRAQAKKTAGRRDHQEGTGGVIRGSDKSGGGTWTV